MFLLQGSRINSIVKVNSAIFDTLYDVYMIETEVYQLGSRVSKHGNLASAISKKKS